MGGGREYGLSAPHNLLSESWRMLLPHTYLSLYSQRQKRELTLTFFLCTDSQVISVNPSPLPSKHNPAGQPDSLLSCICALLFCSHTTGRVSHMKASSSPLISAWQSGWSWLCFRFTDPLLLASAQENLYSWLPLTERQHTLHTSSLIPDACLVYSSSLTLVCSY